MKKAIFILTFASIATFGLSQLQQQQPKNYPASLTLEEWNWVLTQIDNSATPGTVRKPIQEKLAVQINNQVQADMQAQQKNSKKDSTSKRP